ncbi:DUF4328 domain-containing protein [Streptomyces sp. JJ38]|nr:DUF4328 domain-containing protein [Streptomyces sp. JJ38]
MGTVFLAEGGRGERVALKSIRHGYADEPGFRARFAREIETASMVRAEGIAQVVDSEPGEGGQRPWVATEFVPGLSVQRLVATQGPLPARSAGALAAGLARALRAVHAAGLVHRDVKPSNILLTVEGPRLIDFGVARLVDVSTDGGLTRTGASVGSPGYMSPEQVLGRSLSAASDIFGLGGVLVFATTGELPFPVEDTGNHHALMFAVVQRDPDLGRVPAELRDTVAACLAKDPAERPDASALAERLGAYADGSAEGAGPPGGDPWLPARALAEVARISGRAIAQGEWRREGEGGGAGASGDGGRSAGAFGGDDHAAGASGGDGDARRAGAGPVGRARPPAPAAPSPPPSAGGLAQAPTVTAASASAPRVPPRPPAPGPPPGRGPAGRSTAPRPSRPHYVRREPIPSAPRRFAVPPGAADGRAGQPSSPWGAHQAALRSPEGLAVVLYWLYGFYIVFKCVAVVVHLGFAEEIDAWAQADFALWTDVDRLVADASTLSTVEALVGLAVGVPTLCWFWRVRSNAEVFAPGGHRYPPGMAVGSWFIPVAGWIIPGKVTFDIWDASIPSRERARPGQRQPGHGLLAVWWTFTVVCGVALCVLFLLPGVLEGAAERENGVIDFDRMLTATRWGAFLNLLCIPGAALFIAVVSRLTDLQVRRAADRRA